MSEVHRMGHDDVRAGLGVIGGWLGLALAHIAEINAVLQALALVAAICASLASLRYYRRRTPK